ncbi:MAG TPA: hypothetical protein VFX59_13190 [Polyangiales bacterium]|nr:hypothetical protein [Polyangiales bacterium]
MKERALDIACWDYDRVRALVDGTVKIEGVEAKFHTARIVTEIFEGMIRGHSYDVSELGMTYLLRTFTHGSAPLVALPVFVNRVFRHSAIYVNKRAGITRPQDLNGKRIGELAVYGHDAGIMAKGFLADEFGFRPETCRWVVGGIDFPMQPIDFIPQPHPADVQVTTVGRETDLGEMLERGELDALISADVPKCVLEGSPHVGRLFEDFVTVERDYYRRTGIFPIMHAVAVRRELAEREPEVVKAVYAAFCAAKQVTQKQLLQGMTFHNMSTMIPWLTALIAEDRALLGDDWWPYGIAANAKALDAVLRYHYEQGITERRYAIEEVFVPYLLQT